MPQPVNQNIVILAKVFRPSIFSETWLVKNRIVASEDSFVGNRIVSDDFTSINCSAFDLSALSDRLQLTLNHASHTSKELQDAAVAVVKAIGDAGYSAIGLNHVLKFDAQANHVTDVVKMTQDCLRPSGPLAGIFKNDCSWGTHAFTQWNGFAERVKFVPAFPKGDSTQPPSFIIVECNFHMDLDGSADAAKKAIDAVSQFCDAEHEADRVANSLLSYKQ